MAQNSDIGWTNDTWNPWQGCEKTSQGCKNCYMYRDMKRYGRDPSTVVRSKPATFNAPLTKLKGPLVFTCSWSDFFIEEADTWRDEAWDIIKKTPHLTYQILTKRPENILDRLPKNWDFGYSNVWLGVSVEDRKSLWRMDKLADIPAQLRFISYEPALEYVNFCTDSLSYFSWLISGGESGYQPRPANLNWFRQVREDCQANGVLYFHKQHGGSKKINGVWGGRVLDGQTWDQIPNFKVATRPAKPEQMRMF